MGKRLTEGQKLGRAAVRAAARDVIKALDKFQGRRSSVFFEAHFHLDCWRFDEGFAFGGPIKSGLPTYQYAWSGRRDATPQEIEAARDRERRASNQHC